MDAGLSETGLAPSGILRGFGDFSEIHWTVAAALVAVTSLS